MFNDLVDQFESALCNLITTNRSQIVAAMRSGYESGTPIAAISFGVFPWYESLEVSLGSKEDFLERITAQGDWKHYSICGSLNSPTDAVATAVTHMVQFYTGDEDDEDEEENVSQKRANVLFFAAAKALTSEEFWRVLNPIRLSVLEDLAAAGRGTGFTDFEMREINEGGSRLLCAVMDGDATIRANYCELINAMELLGDHSEDVLGNLT